MIIVNGETTSAGGASVEVKDGGSQSPDVDTGSDQPLDPDALAKRGVHGPVAQIASAEVVSPVAAPQQPGDAQRDRVWNPAAGAAHAGAEQMNLEQGTVRPTQSVLGHGVGGITQAPGLYTGGVHVSPGTTSPTDDNRMPNPEDTDHGGPNSRATIAPAAATRTITHPHTTATTIITHTTNGR
jgi:hypothetical protein